MCIRSGGSHWANHGALNIVDTALSKFEKLSLP
jgi:hypothetical protein